MRVILFAIILTVLATPASAKQWAINTDDAKAVKRAAKQADQVQNNQIEVGTVETPHGTYVIVTIPDEALTPQKAHAIEQKMFKEGKPKRPENDQGEGEGRRADHLNRRNIETGSEAELRRLLRRHHDYVIDTEE